MSHPLGKRNSIEIRRPSRADVGAINEMVFASKAHWGYDAEFMTKAKEELTVRSEDLVGLDMWIAEQDDRVVGVYAIDGEAPHGELTYLFVTPQLIGKGVGGLLWQHMLARTAERRFATLVFESDPNAEPFYRSRGAEPIGERISWSTGRALSLLRIEVGSPTMDAQSSD